MTADALIVVDKVAAAVDDELAPINLQSLGVMGRVTVDDIGTGLVDQLVSERYLTLANVVTPVTAPMYGRDDDIVRANIMCFDRRSVAEFKTVDTSLTATRRPGRRNAAGAMSKAEDQQTRSSGDMLYQVPRLSILPRSG